MNIEEVIREAKEVRNKLIENNELVQHIDTCRAYIPVPKVGDGKIKVIFIGQDPTVRRKESRDKITTVLNLNKRNSLYQYLSDITTKLDYGIEQNVYATNLLKCFYEVPPASSPNLMKLHTPYWMELLIAELEQYPDAKVITLGEPVLKALVTNGYEKVRDYWGYNGNNQADVTQFNYCEADNNLIQRRIYPFPHQPSVRKEFYKTNLEKYIDFVNAHKV